MEDELDDTQMEAFNALFSPVYPVHKGQVKRITRINPAFGKHVAWLQDFLKEYENEYKSLTLNLGGKSFFINGYLQQLLDHYVKSNKKKWDCVILITGVEGSAKTTLAKAVAWYLTKKYNENTPFTNDNVVFTVDQFYDVVDNARKGSCILWDEFVLAGMSTDMGAIQNAIIKKFTLIRKKQLFIILVIPYMWMLRSYFAIARTKLLINVYSPDFIRRGFYAVWGFNKKKELYFKGCMTGSKWSYKTVQPDFHGNFLKDIAQPNFFTDDREYERKKDAATIEISTTGKSLTKKEKEDLKDEEEKKNGVKTSKICGTCKTRKVFFIPKTKSFLCKVCNKTIV